MRDGFFQFIVSINIVFQPPEDGHAFSVERVRVGLDFRGYQFGVAGNFQQLGTDFKTNDNLGGFVRKSF